MNLKTLGVLYEEESIYKISLEAAFCLWFIFWYIGVGRKGNSTHEIVTFIFFIIKSPFYIFIDQLGHRNKNEKPVLSPRKSYSNGEGKHFLKKE